jgi:hypothetical protein
MAANNASTLLFSVTFGIAIFDETVASPAGRAVPAWIGLVVAVAGVVLLAGRPAAERQADLARSST